MRKVIDTGNDRRESIPFWNVNVPRAKWTSECPEYLANIDESDRRQLSLWDDEYKVQSWEEVTEIIRSNRLESFKRLPSQLHEYRRHMGILKAEHGSVMGFILKNRVQWNDLTAKGQPFEYEEDMRILLNDWPYGIDPKIVHIVVWTKFSFEEESSTGDLTADARKQIDAFIGTTFRKAMNPEHVVWFKNWAALKSIHAVEHIHVMLYDPDPSFVKSITNHDERV